MGLARSEPVKDQAVKALPGASIDPAELGEAACTRGDLPRIAREPREVALGIAEVYATGGDREATEVVGEPARVHEVMLVMIAHRDPVDLSGDAMTTGGAKQRIVVVVTGVLDQAFGIW